MKTQRAVETAPQKITIARVYPVKRPTAFYGSANVRVRLVVSHAITREYRIGTGAAVERLPHSVIIHVTLSTYYV